jgi:hypothetical protein
MFLKNSLAMARYKKDLLDKLEGSLFNTREVKLTAAEESLKTRIEDIFAVWLEKPYLTDDKIRRYIKDKFQYDINKANRELYLVKYLLGNVRNAAKEWQRYTVIEMAKRAYSMALIREDINAMVAAANLLIKCCKLDRDEDETPPYEKVFVPEWEITTDVSVLGLGPIPDLEKKKAALRKKYGSEIQEAVIISNGKSD